MGPPSAVPEAPSGDVSPSPHGADLVEEPIHRFPNGSPRQSPVRSPPRSPSRSPSRSPIRAVSRTPNLSPEQSPGRLRMSASPHDDTDIDVREVSPLGIRSPNGSPTPTTPQRSPRRRGIVSPVSLPVRSSDQGLPTVHEDAALVTEGVVTPKASFYAEHAVPTSPEESPGRASLFSVIRDYPDPDLIFDDDDDRLPPPEPSPRTAAGHTGPNPDVYAISSPELDEDELSVGDNDFDEAALDENLLTDQAFGERVEPHHVEYREHAETQSMVLDGGSSHHHHNSSVFYPAPVPTKLLLPPLLSRRSLAKSQKNPARMRPKSTVHLSGIPEPPAWGASPLEEEIQYLNQTSPGSPYEPRPASAFGQALYDSDEGSDVDSDRATVMSDDRDDDLDDPLDTNFESNPAASRKTKRSWLGRGWEKFTKKDGSRPEDGGRSGDAFDEDEALALQAQAAVVDNDIAFSRLDPSTVQRHSQMFQSGGMYGGVAPSTSGPTSLIEEIEIRKAGRKVQQKMWLREAAEMERQRIEDEKSAYRHPADLAGSTTQPTLLQMQALADMDYKTRKDWHARAINKNYIQENVGESLAQRRARLRSSKNAVQAGTGADSASPPETLAQRRARLRKQRSKSSTPSVAAESFDVPSLPPTPQIRNVNEASPAHDGAPVTPRQSVSPQFETPREFDMVEAVATMSPSSRMFQSPA